MKCKQCNKEMILDNNGYFRCYRHDKKLKRNLICINDEIKDSDVRRPKY